MPWKQRVIPDNKLRQCCTAISVRGAFAQVSRVESSDQFHKSSFSGLVLVTVRFGWTNYIRKKTFHPCNVRKDLEISNSSSHDMR